MLSPFFPKISLMKKHSMMKKEQQRIEGDHWRRHGRKEWKEGKEHREMNVLSGTQNSIALTSSSLPKSYPYPFHPHTHSSFSLWWSEFEKEKLKTLCVCMCVCVCVDNREYFTLLWSMLFQPAWDQSLVCSLVINYIFGSLCQPRAGVLQGRSLLLCL